jgi:alpha-glucosidase
MKKILFILSFFVLISASFSTLYGVESGEDGESIVGSCLSYKVEANKVVFHCENEIDVQLELVGQGMIKIWFDSDGFVRSNESFAVIRQGDPSENMNIAETAQGYEIYTGDLIVRINKTPFQIKIFDKYQRLLMEDYLEKAMISTSSSISTYKTLKSGERIYGLGEKNGSINRTGSTFKMRNSDKPCYQIHEDPLYKSIPFFMSSEGYGIFFDNTYKANFDFGSTSDKYYSFSAPGGEMIYYFIYGPSFKQMITRYTELTGKAIMPPAWGLGFSQCRGLLTNENLSLEIARGYRDRQIPCDIIYQDIGWTQFLQDFEWRDGNYNNPVEMIENLECDGFKVVVSQDPVVSQVNVSQWTEADSMGYFALDQRTGLSYDMPWPWGGNCGVVDFTHPEVADWWGSLQQKVIDDGVRGFWTDMGEPAWSNEESSDRLHMQHYMGTHEEIHNVYGHTWDKVVTEQFELRNPNTRVFQMTRAGFAGMQRYTFGWSGDAGNGNDVISGWDQLAAQVPISMSSGMGLIPFWSCDISGYCGDIEDYDAMSELYIRWLQFGAFNPLSRIHHEGNNAVEPWLFGDEAEIICKSAIENKYRLFPYIYSYAREAYDKGWPLIRALVLEYPEDQETFDLNTQFMFGEEMLVAPVVEEGASTKRIYLPKGEWIGFNDKSTSYEGNQWIDYPVILESIPQFVKKGSIIPQMPVMQYIGEESDYPLILEVFPASGNRKASFSVYEDDGENNDYKTDHFVKRKIECRSMKEGYAISYDELIGGDFEAVDRDMIYILHLEEKPSAVLLSDKKMKTFKAEGRDVIAGEIMKKAAWSWDNNNKQCMIRIPSEQRDEKIWIEK